MVSLSQIIENDKSIDTIIIASGKFNDSTSLQQNGRVFDPCFTLKALEYCSRHDKHMRYHALFDQSHLEALLMEGKGLKDHDEVLAMMKSFVKQSMGFIEQSNKELTDGTKLINSVEIFNELVEKNKSDKSTPYAMVWEKHFGITVEELVSCFKDVKKPNGVEFMYNETTLTESPLKRTMVEKVLFQIEQSNPNLIDSFGDQMHLSDEDVITKHGIQNLSDTAKMVKRVQDGRLIVDGQEKHITPKKVECTEHDFHFTKSLIDNANKFKASGGNLNLWEVKRGMQSVISDTYQESGVKFANSTYWTVLGQNDHNLVRENKKIQSQNEERKKKGMKEIPLVKTMSAGLVPDGKALPHNLKENKQNYFKWNSTTEQKKYELLKTKNNIKNAAMMQQIPNQRVFDNQKKLKKKNPSENKSAGFVSAFLITLITGFAGGVIASALYFLTIR